VLPGASWSFSRLGIIAWSSPIQAADGIFAVFTRQGGSRGFSKDGDCARELGGLGTMRMMTIFCQVRGPCRDSDEIPSSEWVTEGTVHAPVFAIHSAAIIGPSFGRLRTLFRVIACYHAI
jgi:hypothetical protein